MHFTIRSRFAGGLITDVLEALEVLLSLCSRETTCLARGDSTWTRSSCKMSKSGARRQKATDSFDQK